MEHKKTLEIAQLPVSMDELRKRPLSKGRTAIDVRNVFNVAVDVWGLAPRDVKDVLRERFNDVSICVKRERERR